jgi:hypothetical protein
VKCACGCQRQLGFRQRGSNGCLRTARRLVDEMQALGFENDEDEYRRAFLFEGVSWRNQYTRVLHGELTRDEIRSGDAWAAWLSGARIAVKQARRERR